MRFQFLFLFFHFIFLSGLCRCIHCVLGCDFSGSRLSMQLATLELESTQCNHELWRGRDEHIYIPSSSTRQRIKPSTWMMLDLSAV